MSGTGLSSTLAELARRVDADLRARLFPYRVQYGPERAPRTTPSVPGIIIARDTELGDGIGPPIGAKINPECPFTRGVAGVALVYARSPRKGARVDEHEAEADTVADGVLTAMYDICKVACLPLAITEYRMLGEKDFEGCEAWAGRAVQIRFEVTEHVRRLTYKGEARSTGEVFDVYAPLVTSDGLPDFDPAHGA